MVKGLDRFREYFAAYGDRYILIGGVATWLVLDEAGLEPRATRDLDMVLCIEALDFEFARLFWGFIRAGGYQVREKSSGERNFYRFSRPSEEGYPEMLELFSRRPDELVLGNDSHLTPIPIAEDVSSLSAVLLDDTCYQFICENVTKRDGMSVVDEQCLIPLKAKAWLDLTDRKANGDRVDSKDIRKHRNDVLRLFQVLEPDSRIALPDSMARDLGLFLNRAGPDIDDNTLRNLKIKGITSDEVMDTVRGIFGLTKPGAEDL